MGNPLSAVLPVLLLLAPMPSRDTHMTDIGIDPIPPVVGSTVTFTAGPNMKIKVEWDPGGVIELRTDSDGKATYTVPSGATSVTVSDPSGSYASNSSAVSP